MQKHTVKLILRSNKKNKLKHIAIYLRITIDRKTNYIATGWYIPKGQWDERSESVKPDYAYAGEINRDIAEKKREVLGRILDAAYKKEIVSSTIIKEQATQKGDLTNIFEFSDAYREEMKSKREGGTLENWRKHLSKLEEYHGSRSLHFEGITVNYLNQFEGYLRAGGIEGRKDPSNYIHAIMKSIRKMFNAARGKGLIQVYPFGEGQYELPAATPDDKDRLTLEELDRLEEYADTTTHPRRRISATWFLFGCYTGYRVSDWFVFDFQKHYHRTYISVQATKNDGWSGIPITPRLRRVLDRCKKVPLDTWEQKINEDLKEICKELKIKKSLTTHSGRKTFAVTLCAEMGIPSETCANMMGITLTICVRNYYRVTAEKVRKEVEAAWANI